MKISSLDDPAFEELCQMLAVRATELDRTNAWPEEQLRSCGERGIFEWSVDSAWGGQAWDAEKVVRGYLALSAACLTTTFIITQLTGACRCIAGSDNDVAKKRFLPSLARGEQHATMGISQLTTSRQHLTTPVLRAEKTDGGFMFDGYSPWVTGAAHADAVVVGATLMDGDRPTGLQMLAAIPTDLPGVSMPKSFQMIGITASHTGPVRFDRVFVADEWLLAGPVEDVVHSGIGAETGRYETSTLAIGLADAAIGYLQDEAAKRSNLDIPLDALRAEHTALRDELLAIARGQSSVTNDALRHRANSLVLRATQSALTAAKGAGYVIGHPTGRWCREAIFFLVWSCPKSVLTSNLCELARVEQAVEDYPNGKRNA